MVRFARLRSPAVGRKFHCYASLGGESRDPFTNPQSVESVFVDASRQCWVELIARSREQPQTTGVRQNRVGGGTQDRVENLPHVVSGAQGRANPIDGSLKLIPRGLEVRDGRVEVVTHLVEGVSELADLVVGANWNPVIEVAAGDRSGAIGQLLERTYDEASQYDRRARPSRSQPEATDQPTHRGFCARDLNLPRKESTPSHTCLRHRAGRPPPARCRPPGSRGLPSRTPSTGITLCEALRGGDDLILRHQMNLESLLSRCP